MKPQWSFSYKADICRISELDILYVVLSVARVREMEDVCFDFTVFQVSFSLKRRLERR
jgi:hypothetical protein